MDKSVRFLCQFFSGVNVPKIIKIGYFWQFYSKVDIFLGTQCIVSALLGKTRKCESCTLSNTVLMVCQSSAGCCLISSILSRLVGLKEPCRGPDAPWEGAWRCSLFPHHFARTHATHTRTHAHTHARTHTHTHTDFDGLCITHLSAQGCVFCGFHLY